MTRIVLFDWMGGGHHPIYVQRVVEAMRDSVDVLLAMPQDTLDAVGDLKVDTLSLGDARPRLSGRLRRRTVLREEVELLREAARHGDQLMHLYGDHVLPHLAAGRSLGSRTSLLLFYPRAHYPSAYGTSLAARDRAIAVAKEWALGVWRRRPEAQAVFTLDEEAARRWALRPGAEAHWFPEPPVAALPFAERAAIRCGCVLYGALAARKGIGLVARALSLEQTNLRLVLAGDPDASYLPELEGHIAAMTANGLDVDLRPRRHSELEGLRILAGANCALLPYHYHSGMSRVLLEACSVATPVVADRFGLLGHLVRTHGLGLSVDCRNPRELRTAIMSLAEPDTAAAYATRLIAFASRFSPPRFRAALLTGLGLS